jgi:iron-sulfur cluster assembly protein
MITVTNTAGDRIKKNLTQRGTGMGIRLGVRTTGCSGLAYVLEYVDALAPEDTAFEQDGFVVVVDPKSLTLMDGLEVDYVRQGLNEGFEFKNPNEKDRCGCGESFRI